MKHPQRLPLDEVYHLLPEEDKQNKRVLIFHKSLGVAIGINGFFFRHLGSIGTPYLVEDYRMGLVVRGTLHGIINLREYTISEGSVVFITPGTIVEPLGASDDFLLNGVGLSADEFQLAHGGRVPPLFGGRVSDGRKVLTAGQRVLADRMFRLLHDFMEQEGTCDGVVYSMVTAITHYYDQLFSEGVSVPVPSHANELFNRFLRLVNLHGQREHQLAFYADKLCITPRYLGTVVLSVSGVGAKDWIDRAVISVAKVLLRHSDKQTSRIAEELNFPNASFFCKYFKRLTGFTPLQYRNGK